MDGRVRAVLAAATTTLAVLLTGCASSAAPAPARGGGSGTAATCRPPGGGRCAGSQPVHELAIKAAGRRLVGIFLCGGRLSGRETAQAVFVTYVASAVRAGGMACARVKLSVALAQPLGNRRVIDATSHRAVPLKFCHPDRRVSDDPLDPCW